MITPESLDLLLPGPPVPRDSWAWATVTQVSPLRVRMDGEASALGVAPDLRGGTVAVGDRVWCQRSGGRLVAFAGLVDTGWVALTLDSTLRGYLPGVYDPQIRLVGHQVKCRGIIQRVSGSFATSTVYPLGTVPAGFRPPSSQDAVFLSAAAIVTGTLPATVKVSPSGAWEMRTPASSVSTTGYSLASLSWTND